MFVFIHLNLSFVYFVVYRNILICGVNVYHFRGRIRKICSREFAFLIYTASTVCIVLHSVVFLVNSYDTIWLSNTVLSCTHSCYVFTMYGSVI